MKRSERTASTAYPPVLMDEQTAAAYVSLSVSTLRERGRDLGFPPCVRVGRRVLYRVADIDRWAASLPTDDEAAEWDEQRKTDQLFNCAG